ncbi:tRNA (adenosine(37)-N6)-threonylcarbamoyltransferase complex dimerization subunit type 1 TsaB [Alistipes sp. OttesenSCG-928-B03]|nr:tRNA (adenosine(37)-N6)-threonylcarbamoyltransferase complex dimerization subunit type 1 TsaB [Alistipes sp. OttesenSCG-928-B03]
MALILGIETGTDICSVSLSRDGELLALRESEGGQDHARKLAVYIDEILRSNDYAPDELDAVAVGRGPGSYTGLRIGVSTAKGMCYALGIPLVAVGSLEALAWVATEDNEAGILDVEEWGSAMLCPMIDARRMEVYAQVFDSAVRPVSEVGAHIITPESFAEHISPDREFVIFGNGAAKCVDTLPSEGVKYVEVTPSARGLVRPAHEAFAAGRFEDIAYFEPFYLKDFVVTSSKKRMF